MNWFSHYPLKKVIDKKLFNSPKQLLAFLVRPII